MKYYIQLTVAIIGLNIGSYSVCSQLNTPYSLKLITVGDNAIVNAIKQYSNITESYVNKWKPFGLWLIGPSIRAGVVNVINNYIRVCKGLKLANYSFTDEVSLREAFPVNWTIGALCLALKNLKEQAMKSLALVEQVGAESGDVKGIDSTITSYMAIIDHNRNVLKPACAALTAKKIAKEAEAVKLALDKATINEKKVKSWADKFGIVKTINMLIAPESAALLGLYYVAAQMGISNPEASK
jgi:hypothetical protein